MHFRGHVIQKENLMLKKVELFQESGFNEKAMEILKPAKSFQSIPMILTASSVLLF
jgi:hypothetical protein